MSFASYDALHATLSPTRPSIVGPLTEQGSLLIQKVARQIGRDIQVVYQDMTRLINAGIVTRTAGGVRCNHEGLEFSFRIHAEP